MEDGSDWFCYHSSSRLIFPINFCQRNHLQLAPPLEYQGDFQWDKYLTETKSQAVSEEHFQITKVDFSKQIIPLHKNLSRFSFLFKDQTKNPFSVGMKIEAVDMITPHLVCVATVAKVAENLIRVHFDGWGDDFEQWIDCQSTNIYPIGWCELVGYKLEPPKQPEQDQLAETNKRSSKKSSNRKSNKRKRLT